MRVALIGLGMVAGTHLAAIKAAGFTLAWAMGRDRARTQDFASDAATQLGHAVRATTDIADIANDPDLDFAIVATPPDARSDLIGPLAQAGKPVLLEKPIARTLAEAEALVDLCARADAPLGIVFQVRMRAEVAALRAALPKLGPLGMVEVSVPWWRDQAYYDAPGRGTYSRDGGGVLITQAIHTLDLMLSLAGPVRTVRALSATTNLHRLQAEDFVSAGLTFQGGAVGHLMATTAAFPGGAERIVLHGAMGTAELTPGHLRVHMRDGTSKEVGHAAGSGGGADPMAFSHAWHQGILEDFAQALRQGRAPVAPGREALRVHALIDGIERAAASGQEVEL